MTIKEIALKAGVSIGTVDRVLHKRGRVAEDTKKRILEIVEESGYHQNLFASNLANSRKTYTIAVVMPHLDQDSYYWSLVKNGIDTALNELKGFNVEIELICFDRFSGDDFTKVYRKVKDSGYDGVFIAPVILKAAKKCFMENPPDVPFAFFDSDLSDIKPLFFIGQDSFQGGMLGGKLLHLLTNTGNVGVTKMLPEGYHINERVNGFKSYFKQFPSIKVYEFEINYMEYKKNIISTCSEILNNYTDIEGLFVTNANTHYFAEAIRELNPEREVKMVGFDLVDENRACLEDKSIDFVISQNPEMQAAKGLNLLSKWIILKHECERQYPVPLDIITKENLM